MIKDIISELSHENHLFFNQALTGKGGFGMLSCNRIFHGCKKTNKQEKKNIKNVKYVWKKKRTKKILPVANYRQSAFSKSLLSRTHVEFS